MPEWIPIILALCLGVCLRPAVNRPLCVMVAAAGVLLIAVSAFVMSSEYDVSWAYLAFDLLQSLTGLLAGILAFQSARRAADLWARRTDLS